MTGNATEDRLLTPRQLSAYIGLEVGTIYNRVSRGEIPYEKAGRLLRFRKSDIDAWLSAHNEQPAIVAPAEADVA
jgi:excisionase family DNA binding protein